MKRGSVIAVVIISGFLIANVQASFTNVTGVAWASGGGGGGEEDGTINISDDPPKAVPKKKPAKKKEVHPKVKIAHDYPQSRYREIRDFQSWIATHAKKDDLKWIATNEKQLKKFVLTYEKFKNKYKGLKALEVHKIFTQLKKYSKQKKYPELAKCAKGMLHSFTVYDHLRYARAKYEAWKKAPKGIKKDIAKGEYVEAQDEYYKSRSKLPRRMIMSFPVIKDIR